MHHLGSPGFIFEVQPGDSALRPEWWHNTSVGGGSTSAKRRDQVSQGWGVALELGAVEVPLFILVPNRFWRFHHVPPKPSETKSLFFLDAAHL